MSQLKIERNVVELNSYVCVCVYICTYIYIYIYIHRIARNGNFQVVYNILLYGSKQFFNYQKCVDEKIGFFWTLFVILLLKITYNDLFVTKREKNKKFLDRS